MNNIYTKILNKMNGQIRSLKVKNNTFNEMERVCLVNTLLPCSLGQKVMAESMIH